MVNMFVIECEGLCFVCGMHLKLSVESYNNHEVYTVNCCEYATCVGAEKKLDLLYFACQ
jgi:hypothetical protein